MLIRTAAAPECGSIGSARVAEMNAAIETLKAGFDGYIIDGAGSQNNISTYQTGGTVQTSLYGNTAQSTYYPGTTIYTGTYDTTFSIRMFRKGEPGYKNAVPARDILGPHWEQRVKVGAMQTCNASLPN
uniref:Uncharacterized protein n=2 Tax=Aureimonas frigidaquae TaxID=424757 RepID=A0A0P0Z2B7_9HYPH|nr:hypothetical protein [Aureimonas frigidaquae]